MPLSPRSRKDEEDNHTSGGDDEGFSLWKWIPAMVVLVPLLIILGLAVPAFAIAFMVVGGLHVDDCAIQPMIPVWLIVQGVLMLLGLAIRGCTRSLSSQTGTVPFPIMVLSGVTALFGLAWFIAGNVWVFQAWSEGVDYAHASYGNGCDKGTFLLTFIFIIAADAMMGLSLLLTVITLAARVFCKPR